jgi:hypothetical protein
VAVAVTRGLTGRSRRQGGGTRVACAAGACQCQREPQRTIYRDRTSVAGDRRGRQGRRRGARGAMGLLDRKPGSVPERNLKLDPAAAGSD